MLFESSFHPSLLLCRIRAVAMGLRAVARVTSPCCPQGKRRRESPRTGHLPEAPPPIGWSGTRWAGSGSEGFWDAHSQPTLQSQSTSCPEDQRTGVSFSRHQHWSSNPPPHRLLLLYNGRERSLGFKAQISASLHHNNNPYASRVRRQTSIFKTYRLK